MKNVDAYVVGMVGDHELVELSPDTYELQGVPLGNHEVIITGSVSGTEEISGFSHGIRMNRTIDLENSELGLVELPQAGSLSGTLTMEGVDSFETVRLDISGTKIEPVAPTADGSYRFAALPVGEHDLAIHQESLDNQVRLESEVQEARDHVLDRLKAISRPNQVTNLVLSSGNQRIALSWSSGGAGTTGYLILRSTRPILASPVTGTQYQVGDPVGNAQVIASLDLKTTYYVDRELSNGTTYYYSVLARNQNYLYSVESNTSAFPQNLGNEFSYYRLNIESTAIDCYSTYSTEVQSIHFYIDGQWQTNHFDESEIIAYALGGGRYKFKGKIGPYSTLVSVNNVYSVFYEAFYAFQDNSIPWSSSDRAFAKKSPYDAKSDIYFEIHFDEEPLVIDGLKIIGGEPPEFTPCSPDQYRLVGSQDGVTWTEIPGSFNNQDSSLPGVQYYFTPKTEPLTPINYELISNAGQVSHSWQTAAGPETSYLLVRSKTPVPFEPEHGLSYSLGAYGDYEVVFIGSETGFEDTGLATDGTVYYYTLVSFDESHRYSRSVAEYAIPESRAIHEFYRFYVDSIYVCNGKKTSNELYMESLELQFDGQWLVATITDSEQGVVTFGSHQARITSRSERAAFPAYQVFSGDSSPWRSEGVFLGEYCGTDQEVYIEFQFTSPVAVTGFRAFGNDFYDESGNFSQKQFDSLPDQVHMTYSNDGIQWTIIYGSVLEEGLYAPYQQTW